MPNKRAQDGLKLPLLCRACEQLFSRWETAFASRIFRPLLANASQEIEYEEWLLKFCVSISWRVLVYLHLEDQDDHLSQEQLRESGRAMRVWSEFLLDQREHPEEYVQHLILFERIEVLNYEAAPPNLNRYLLRGFEFDLVRTSTTLFTTAKLGPFLLIGVIQPTETSIRGGKVHLRSGVIGPTEYKIPGQFKKYWEERAALFSDFAKNITPNQKALIERDILADPKRFVESGTFRAMAEDVRLFGRRAFDKED